jgi:hypothetical protein
MERADSVLIASITRSAFSFVGGEGGVYGTAVAGNLVYGQQGLVGIDDLMRPSRDVHLSPPGGRPVNSRYTSLMSRQVNNPG